MKYLAALTLCFFVAEVYSQTADFSFQSPTGTLCAPTQIRFTQTSGAGAAGFIWDFGDGSKSNDANPVHAYEYAGSYTVKLTTIYKQTTSTVTKNLLVHGPNSISLSADRSVLCTSGDVSFSVAGGMQQSYQWDFGDGSTQTTSSPNATHTFNGYQNYTVTALATDTNGCTASATVPVTLTEATVSASASQQSGCIPATSTFTASAILPPGSVVQSYTWDFGDGNSDITTSPSVTHVYASTGEFIPRVSISTTDGCHASFEVPATAFGVPPSGISAHASKNTVCASDTITFFSAAANVTSFGWQFGDGQEAWTPEATTSHQYSTLGTHTVTVTPYDNGCPGDAASFQVETIGLVSLFDYKIDCSQKNKVTFIDQSIGNVSSFEWDYGDGQRNDTLRLPVHQYPANGTYTAALRLHDDVTGCSSEAVRAIHMALPELTNPDTVLCRNDFTVFYMNHSYSNPDALYTYHIVGAVIGPTDYDFMSVIAVNPGDFENFVVIDNGPQYCKDTIYMKRKMRVGGPVTDFSIDSVLCLSADAHLTNHSFSFFPEDSIMVTGWKAGDSVFSSRYQPAEFHFSSPGNQQVRMYATDENGCSDTTTKSVLVQDLPFLKLIPEIDTLCAGQTDSLIAFHNDPLTWSSPTSLPCSDCDTIPVTAAADTYYAVQVRSATGCVSGDTIHLKVHQQFHAVAENPESAICPGDTVSLHAGPPGMAVTWSPAAFLSNSTGYDPVASPTETTRFTALLSDSAGCFSDSTFFTVHVKAPAMVDAGPDTTLPYNATFSINPGYSNNVIKYDWSPPGDLDCVTCRNASGQITKSQTYNIRATSDSGCEAVDSINLYVECNDKGLLLPNAFTPNDDQLNDVFYPIGRGISYIKTFRIYDRYGQVVYSQKNFPPNDKSFGWDGRIRGEPAPISVYLYTIEAECGKGEKILKKGSISLIR